MNDCWTKVEKKLREKFDEYRRMNLFTDVTLIVKNDYGDEVKFSVHRIVLSAVSPYFEKMFSNSMIESVAKEIRLKDIDAESLHVIISVAYCGILELNRANVRGVLIAAEYLGIDFLVNECIEFYAKYLEIDNNSVLEIRNLRYTHGHITSLKLAAEKSNKYVKKNFEKFLKSEQFLDLSINDVVEILGWNGVCVNNEEPIFNSAIQWLEKDIKMRHQYAERVIGAVRLPQLSEQFLIGKVQQNQFVIESECCMERVTKAMEMHLGNSSDARRSAVSRRETEIYVFPFDNGTQTNITKFNCALSEWTQMDLPAALRGRKWFGLAGYGQKIFVTGGFGINTRKCTSFDIISGNVIELRQMLEPSWGHSTIKFQDMMFAFGGDNNGVVLSSAERYVIERDEWLRLSSMRERRFSPASVAHENFIYAIGGYDRGRSLNTVERFDQRVGTWEYVAQMSNRKWGAGAAVLGGNIYVSGGWNGDHLNIVEIYDPRANKWTAGPSMNNARADHGFVSDKSRLLAIVGLTGGDHAQLNSVEVFDGGNQWTLTASMPSIVGRVKAVVL